MVDLGLRFLRWASQKRQVSFLFSLVIAVSGTTFLLLLLRLLSAAMNTHLAASPAAFGPSSTLPSPRPIGPDPSIVISGQKRWHETLYSAERMRDLEKCQPTASPHLTVAQMQTLSGRGEKRVISFGLYGTNQAYIVGAYRNIELAPAIYPGWVVRIYYDDSLPHKDVLRLSQLGAEMVSMSGSGQGDVAGMFWRFLVADDPTVDRFIIRDLDSRLTAREAAAVRDWILSGAAYHIMRDHPNHSPWPMGGGLWGGRYSASLRIGERMQSTVQEAYGNDMQFLRDVIYPLIVEDSLAHDAFSCSACVDPGLCATGIWPNSHPFPVPRVAARHVGQRFDEFERSFPADEQLLVDVPPPPACTPCFSSGLTTPASTLPRTTTRAQGRVSASLAGKTRTTAEPVHVAPATATRTSATRLGQADSREASPRHIRDGSPQAESQQREFLEWQEFQRWRARQPGLMI